MTAIVFERIIKSDKNTDKEDKMNENVQREENMNQITKETFEFLWFSYFGITVETAKGMDSDELIKICTKRAYLDMCRTLRFTEDGDNNSKEENGRETFRDDIICNVILKMIKDCIFKSSESSFDGIHKTICEEIKTRANRKDDVKILKVDFTYGQAQKWLNMTIKYMYLMGFWKDKFEKIEKVLHVPVDSYIIQAVWKTNVFLPLKNEKVNRQSAYSDEKVVSWSQWDDTMYDDFQTSLKKYINDETPYGTPLEWEAEAWIEVAERIKNKQKKD